MQIVRHIFFLLSVTAFIDNQILEIFLYILLVLIIELPLLKDPGI